MVMPILIQRVGDFVNVLRAHISTPTGHDIFNCRSAAFRVDPHSVTASGFDKISSSNRTTFAGTPPLTPSPDAPPNLPAPAPPATTHPSLNAAPSTQTAPHADHASPSQSSFQT